MRVIPGSHKNSKYDHIYYADDDNMIRNSHKISLTIDESKAIDLELQSGEMSIHHDNIIHGSDANNSNTKRMGFAIRYINPNFSDPNRKILYARGLGNNQDEKIIERLEDFQHKYNAPLYKEFLEKNIVLK